MLNTLLLHWISYTSTLYLQTFRIMQTFQIMQFLRFVHNVGFCINDVLQTSLIRIFVRPPWLPGDKTGPGIPSVLLKAFLYYSYMLNCVVEDKYKIFHDTFQIVCGEL